MVESIDNWFSQQLRYCFRSNLFYSHTIEHEVLGALDVVKILEKKIALSLFAERRRPKRTVTRCSVKAYFCDFVEKNNEKSVPLHNKKNQLKTG